MKAPTTTGSGLDKASTSVFRAEGVTVLDRDTAAASSIAAVKSGQAASPLDFANQVRDTVLANRASVRGGAISAAQKSALTKQNIQLMQSTGLKFAMGGMVPKYFASGGYAMGTDTVPAMLTPGEFVVKKYAVESFGTENLKAINNGTYAGESVYNYSVNVSVKSDANPDQIARSVMTQIKQIDSQRIRSNKF
jgi:predicted outer membrane repeat protein